MSQAAEIGEDRKKLDGLLGFARGVLEARGTVQMVMSSGLGVFHESRISDLPKVMTDVEDGLWLKIERQYESRPPEPAPHVAEFLSSKGNDPTKKPTLLPAISTVVSVEEASSLIEGRLLREENVQPFEEEDGSVGDRVSAVLLAEDLSEMRRDFEAYVDGPWSDWAAIEKPIRKSIALYNDLFKINSAIHSAEGTPPELVWGIGIARWKKNQIVIDMPILEQLVDIEVEEGGAICIYPRQMPPILSLKPFLQLEIPGSDRLQKHLQEDLEKILAGDTDLTPFTTAWEPLLASAAHHLSSEGVYVDRVAIADGATLEAPGEDLRITSHWAIFGRPRSSEARAQDLDALRRLLGEGETEIPSSIKGFAAPEPDAPKGDVSSFGLDSNILTAKPETVSWSDGRDNVGTPGLRVSKGEEIASPQGRRVHFFPLPYNEEQSRITDLLREHDVVSATGPPGTGKTHTIANIISHYMATGKRVLVTARTPEAIGAVREKLPESLRSLVIASVGTDREATQQLQDAISELSDEVVGMNPERARSEKERLESEIIALDEEIESADRELARIARANLQSLTWRGEEHSPMALTSLLEEDAAKYGWFSDRPKEVPPTDLDTVLTRLSHELPQLAADIAYAGVKLPDPGNIPTSAELIAAHQALAAREAREVPDYSDAPVMAQDTAGAHEMARAALSELEACREIAASFTELEKSAYQISLRESHESGLTRMAIRHTRHFLANYREYACASEVQFDLGEVPLTEFTEAALRGASGLKPVTFSLFKKDLKDAVASVSVGGRAPSSPEDWDKVCSACRLLEARSSIEEALKPFSEAGISAVLPPAPAEMIDFILNLEAQLGRCLSLQDRMEKGLRGIRILFPYGVDCDRLYRDLDFGAVIHALKANIPDDFQAPAALGSLEALAQKGETQIHTILDDLRRSLGSEDIDEPGILKLRAEITQELSRLVDVQPRLDQMGRDLEALSKAGCLQWRARLEADPTSAESLISKEWREAWAWAMMRARLDEIVALGNGDDMRARKERATRRRRKVFEDLIRVRTMLGLSARMTSSVQRAMAAFTQAVSRIGRGTGKNAPRFRRAAQEAAREAAVAAPVWIMPEFKIPEQLPAEFGSFDLVILDEASQSDITAIAALGRGKKILVVGDEEQVSPTNIGIQSQKINALRAQYLQGLPNASLIDENTSIFETTIRMHPTSHVVLREHFRCVAPIIQFSTRFYQNRLVPLRIPKASERFDPPLVDVYIPGAVRQGKVNKSEAKFIVDEIARLIHDPSHDGRNFGVISLIGHEQSERIERMLIEHPDVGPEKIQERQIILGDARTMQGQERSVVFLSMVATSRDVRAQRSKPDEQRINVAMSRAADRLYLVRSVKLEDMSPNDIKAEVVKHFQDPMPEGRKEESPDLMDRCDSGFEREVLGMLIDAGYRARPQVKAGGFSIDIVVEGHEDRRLAIELDGDQYHGPEVWEQDMARQAALERAGWVFWRVFGSQWNTQKDYWWRDLCDTLGRMKIDPIGAEKLDERFTEFRVVDAFDPDPAREDQVSDTVPADDLSVAVPEVSSASSQDAARLARPSRDNEGRPRPKVDRQASTGNSRSPQSDTNDLQGVFNIFDTSLPDQEFEGEEKGRDAHSQEEDAASVEIGSVVTLEKMFDGGGKMQFTIVENHNAPESGLVGSHTPLGEALLDASIDDVVSYQSGAYLREVRVLAIE